MRTNLFLAPISVTAEANSVHGRFRPPQELISLITEAKLFFTLDWASGNKPASSQLSLERSTFFRKMKLVLGFAYVNEKVKWMFHFVKIFPFFSLLVKRSYHSVKISQISMKFQLEFWIILKFKYAFIHLPFTLTSYLYLYWRCVCNYINILYLSVNTPNLRDL